jgi:hypothetical protein
MLANAGEVKGSKNNFPNGPEQDWQRSIVSDRLLGKPGKLRGFSQKTTDARWNKKG